MTNNATHQKFLALKNLTKVVKPAMRKYRINLNHKLISYIYDDKDKEIRKERMKFLIPLNAKEITLIKDYKEDNKSDPILNVIERGALPEQFENNTLLKYQKHFSSPKKEETIVEVKEQNNQPKEKKQRKQVAKRKD